MTEPEHTIPASECEACNEDAETLAAEFRAQLGIDEDGREVVEGVLLDDPEDALPSPDASRAFHIGYAVGRSAVEAEAAADRVFRRARRRGYVLDAVAVGLGWFIGCALADRQAAR